MKLVQKLSLIFMLILPVFSSWGKGTSLDTIKSRAEQGDAAAQYNLGVNFFKGNGVPQDYTEAVKWFRKASERGVVEAQNDLGYMYANGKGVLKSYVDAYMWFNLAASQNDSNAVKISIENRNGLIKFMTPAQIANAQMKSTEWLKQHQKQKSE